MTMSETTKEMQRLLEEVAATPEVSGKMAEALQHLDFGEIARLANEAGFNVTLEDLLGDSKTVQDIQPLCDEQVRAAVGGSGIFTQCLLDPSLLKIVDPESYKRCHFTQERLKG